MSLMQRLSGMQVIEVGVVVDVVTVWAVDVDMKKRIALSMVRDRT